MLPTGSGGAGSLLSSGPRSASVIYLHTVNGSGVEILPYDRAKALLKHVTTSRFLNVTGDLASGFAWPTPGAVPRRSQAVIPLPAPLWPLKPYAPVVIELWWAPDSSGYRKVRSFLWFFVDPYEAYLVACCLWATRSTGEGAVAAYLYGPDRQTAYRVNEQAKACSPLPINTITQIAVLACDRDTTDPLPDQLPPMGADTEFFATGFENEAA